MPPKRIFRESKSALEEQSFQKKSVPSSTRYVTKWSVKIFVSWQSGRPNKNPGLKEIGFKAEIEKIQSLDINIVNMTAESLDFGWRSLSKRFAKRMDSDNPLDLCIA